MMLPSLKSGMHIFSPLENRCLFVIQSRRPPNGNRFNFMNERCLRLIENSIDKFSSISNVAEIPATKWWKICGAMHFALNNFHLRKGDSNSLVTIFNNWFDPFIHKIISNDSDTHYYSNERLTLPKPFQAYIQFAIYKLAEKVISSALKPDWF